MADGERLIRTLNTPMKLGWLTGPWLLVRFQQHPHNCCKVHCLAQLGVNCQWFKYLNEPPYVGTLRMMQFRGLRILHLFKVDLWDFCLRRQKWRKTYVVDVLPFRGKRKIMRLNVNDFEVCVDHCQVETSFVRDFGVWIVNFLSPCCFRDDYLNFAHGEACLLESGSILSK